MTAILQATDAPIVSSLLAHKINGIIGNGIGSSEPGGRSNRARTGAFHVDDVPPAHVDRTDGLDHS